MSNLLTDRIFWENYWKNKNDIARKIPEKDIFFPFIQNFLKNKPIKTSIELGGFPGFYSIYLRKKFGLKVTLLDYFVYQPIIDKFLELNDLRPNEIEVIEADLFNYHNAKIYDLVFSFGLIEHFEDTRDIIDRHLPFMSENGHLLITLPNFRSVNGWFQKKFDPENYRIHNIKSMDPALLTSIAKELGLKDVKCKYYGRFSVWLEDEENKPAHVRLLKKTVWIIGKVFTKLIPFESKWLSPYIVLTGRR